MSRAPHHTPPPARPPPTSAMCESAAAAPALSVAKKSKGKKGKGKSRRLLESDLDPNDVGAVQARPASVSVLQNGGDNRCVVPWSFQQSLVRLVGIWECTMQNQQSLVVLE